MNLDPNGTLRAVGDADEISSTTTINDLRAAYALQKFLEKNARAGTRYTETLLAHYNVRSSDARLQRAEYIGVHAQLWLYLKSYRLRPQYHPAVQF